MDKILIDSDVILDFFFDRQPFVDFATEIFLRCETKEILGFTTPVIICNVYYLLSKTAKHEVIIEKLKQLLSIIGITTMNKDVVIAALNSKFKDFEDALQSCAAQNQGDISIILTRNIKDYKKSELAILSPEMYLNR
ncbi:type II toxin-antitoxin system VapC family toxin [Algoriphagus persicinus]|uniref:type II toxin-antitoxin system VapC family toxin n=1 Tax=Algoriphagus persicinus TaxID=3108754 RepID=UPI002B3D4CEF|nr:PIN domain-containing protein [Algoriphagus sp. E1-3-M2]MEB2784316.1 PIN domain-containing protein [Algoriphagus sp. E1-3-M2]